MTKHRSASQLAARLVAVFFCFTALAIPLSAQNNKGTIVGTVTDPNDALVSGAKVRVTNRATNETREATSTDEGTYTVANLDPGNYSVTVEAAGFRTVVREPITLETNARLPVDVKLELGATGETVTVTAAAPLVESESSVRGDVITGRQVTELPIPQRNFTLLAGLSPGVTRPAVGTLGGGGNFVSGGPGNSTESTRFRESGGSVISANGARVTNNNFTLDGIDNNESQFGQIAIFPNPDAIREFKVETSVPSAESGRAGGAIISTTFKSGTNAVHGTAYEFYQGHFASARPANNANPPNYVVHNFGGVVGGPIFLPRPGEGGSALYDGRDRSFFFFSYNGQRNATPAFGGGEEPVTVPSVKLRSGDFSELLKPGQTRVYNTVRGPVTATLGTIFDANGNPFPGNIIPRNLLSPAAFNIFNAYPLPTSSALEKNFARNRSEKANVNQYDIKIDHNITGRNSIFGRYSSAKNERLRDNNFPLGSSPNNKDLGSGFGAGTEFGNTRQVALGDTQVFSPTVINDARAGYSRFNIGIFNTGQGGAQGFSATNSADLGVRGINACGVTCSGTLLLGIIGTDVDKQLEFIGDGSPFFFVSNNFYFGDTLTVIRGNQAFKFGGDLRVRQNQPGSAGNNAKGQFQYGTQVGGFLSGNYSGIPIGPRDAGSSYANFLLGYSPASTDREVPGGPYLLSNKEISFFVQDDWKARPDLTLNLGLRYDVFTPATERYNRELNFDPKTNSLIRAGGSLGRGLRKTDKNNFGPRVGFAYSGLREDKRLVLRGGYGLLYSTDVGRNSSLAVDQPFNGGGGFNGNLQNYGSPGSLLPSSFNLDSVIPFPLVSFVAGPVIPVTNAFQNVFAVNPQLKDELYHQYNLTLQYEFAPNWLVEAGYVGSLGRNLLIDRNIGRSNQRGPGSREVPGIEFVNFTDDTGRSNYNALQTKLEKRFSKGLSILSAYTWAHALDNGPGRFAGNSTPARDRFGPVNPFMPELEYGNSDLDVRHRFTFANVYDLPFGRGRRFGGDIPRAVNFFLGGFQLNNVITIQSGPVYTVVFGEGGTRPNLVGDPTPTAEQRARRLEFNPGAFAPPNLRIFPNDPNSPTFGTLGRNTFRGERQEFWDLSLFKNFRFNERFNVQTRFQAYNVLNHVNRNVPNRNIEGCFTSNVFDPVQCRNNSLGAPNNLNIGIDTSLQRARQLEFGIKLLF